MHFFVRVLMTSTSEAKLEFAFGFWLQKFKINFCFCCRFKVSSFQIIAWSTNFANQIENLEMDKKIIHQNLKELQFFCQTEQKKFARSDLKVHGIRFQFKNPPLFRVHFCALTHALAPTRTSSHAVISPSHPPTHTHTLTLVHALKTTLGLAIVLKIALPILGLDTLIA